jgi:ABC-type glycerol-3-phosphate transport system substrate-binding protein
VVVTATPEPKEEMEPFTLTVWDFKSGEEVFAAYTKVVADRFMEMHPNVTVEVVPQPHAEYYNVIGAAIAANEGPDVMAFHSGTRLTERQDALIPLDDYVGDDAKNFVGLETAFVNTETGELIALPVTTQGFIYYYNKNIYQEAGLDPEKPPTTWGELVANCEAIMANTDKACFTVGGKADGFQGIAFHSSIWANAIFTPEEHIAFRNGEISYDNPKMVKLLELWAEATERGWWQEGAASTATYMDSHDNFNAGRAAHTQGLISDVAHWKMYGENLGDVNVGMFKNIVIDPAVYDNVEDMPLCAGDGLGWAVAKWSPHPDMAAELVKFMTSPESQLVLYNSAGSMIPRTDIQPELVGQPKVRQIIEWLGNAEIPIFYVTPTELNREWQRQASLLMLGETTVEDAVQAMVELQQSIQ